MRAQLQGAVIAVLEERLAVKPQELFCLLDGNPSSIFGHGAEKRVPIYGIQKPPGVKSLNKPFGFLLLLDTR
jgi:hypothetical protein